MVWNYRAKKHSVCHTNFQTQKLLPAFGVGGGCGPLPGREGRRHSPPDSAPSVLAGPTSVRHVPHLVTARSKPVVRLLQGRQPWTPVVRHERHGQRSLPPAAPPTHNPPDVGEGRSEPDRRRREKPSLWRPTLRPHERGRRPPCVLRRRAAGQATQEAGRAPLRSAPRAASPPSLAPLGCFSSRPRLATAGTGAPTRRGWTLVGAPEP